MGAKQNLVGVHSALTRKGWKCEEVTLLYDRGGTVFKDTVTGLERLRLTKTDIAKQVTKNQNDSITTLYNTIVDRRQAEQHHATREARDPHWDPGGIG